MTGGYGICLHVDVNNGVDMSRETCSDTTINTISISISSSVILYDEIHIYILPVGRGAHVTATITSTATIGCGCECRHLAVGSNEQPLADRQKQLHIGL